MAYLRYRAVNQIHDTFREYHAADEILEAMRGEDQRAAGLRAAVEAACVTLLRHGKEPETIDMVYHLTGGRSSAELIEVLLDRLEADDLPPPGPPLYKDLRSEFLARLDCEPVACDPVLRARAEALLRQRGGHAQIFGLLLRCDPEGRLLDALRTADLSDLTPWAARRSVEQLGTTRPAALLEVAEVFARAPEATRTFLLHTLEEALPGWFTEHQDALREHLG